MSRIHKHVQGKTTYLVTQLSGQGLGRVGGHTLEWPKGRDDDSKLGRRLR